ncbi:MAG: DUF2782 domain-containing protein [Betaproteobacteria bacterium]|nr:DUF2782 domain-containing protein [Betaproteobacteria bacterium]MDH3435853.1 DUF2782 domain-containing protein [Betaproteobacteria bacterium]
MRPLIAALLLAIALPVFAQTDGKPPVLQPLPEPPPPPPGYEPDPALEPQVTILKRGEDTVEEFRINGQLYMVKVTPPHGTPYYLIDRQGDGVFHRQDSLSTDIRPPMWVLFTF